MLWCLLYKIWIQLYKLFNFSFIYLFGTYWIYKLGNCLEAFLVFFYVRVCYKRLSNTRGLSFSYDLSIIHLYLWKAYNDNMGSRFIIYAWAYHFMKSYLLYYKINFFWTNIQKDFFHYLLLMSLFFGYISNNVSIYDCILLGAN